MIILDLLNRELEPERSVARDADSSIEVDFIKIFQKFDPDLQTASAVNYCF